jgi:hypothetical protein
MRTPKRGRPALDDSDPSVDVHLKLPSRVYDDVYQQARSERVTVPELLRQALAQSLRRVNEED